MRRIETSNQHIKVRKLLYAIILTMVFEGIVRKLLPEALGIAIFFIKDVLCLVGLYYIYLYRLPPASKEIVGLYRTLSFLMFPLLLYNIWFDPILFLWGGKLYLLYVVMAILMVIAFPPNAKQEFLKFLRNITFLLIPTVLTGFLQLSLPASHWLNKSVGGDSLEGFSSGGYLRISSTFSFTAQYSVFLVFAAAIFLCTYFLKKTAGKNSTWLDLVLFLLLFLGCYSTGGRTAVLGFLTIVVLGFIINGLKNPLGLIKQLVIPVALFVLVIPLIKEYKPEFFSAYDARSTSSEGGNSNMLQRVLDPFTRISESTLLGNGLGVMTNGADKVSAYANAIRSTGVWTESDFGTILWEGGIILLVIWYGFRLFIIFYAVKILQTIHNKQYAMPAAFLLAYIIVEGLIGTLTIQPPIAIYFWLCVGALICIKQFDEYEYRLTHKLSL